MRCFFIAERGGFEPPIEVPEWLKGPAWKAGIGATLAGVRIPLSPQ